MLSKEVETYIESLIPARSSLIEEMEQYAKGEQVPIMELIGIETLLQLLRIQQPANILEIGTAIGYSAIRMADAVPKAEIVTIERDKERYDKALYFIGKANKEQRIHVLFGDAFEVTEAIQSKAPYDMIFIDAAKGQYQKFFELFEPFLSKDGMIISDNVLFKGYVAQAEETIETKRIRSLTAKIKKYNDWLMSHPDFQTMILPIGDGIAITKRRGEET
ncbi:O-methyltransferase [Priestia abyssalis]|uniref:O-methyltransferase n=1 Tax=Priestia abyssalis TaxID=1221450 RepID=UPI0009959B44|nr:O-methyltransferase [Priestia abyssalis]